MGKPTDKEIMENVIHALISEKKIKSANELATTLKYKSAMSIYKITTRGFDMTDDMKNRIMIYFPVVNRLYLDKGELPILLDDAGTRLQRNLYSVANPEDGERRFSVQDMKDFPERLDRMEKMIEEILSRL